MSNANRIYLKFKGLDWEDDQAIDDFAKSLHGHLVDLLNTDKEFRLQGWDDCKGNPYCQDCLG